MTTQYGYEVGYRSGFSDKHGKWELLLLSGRAGMGYQYFQTEDEAIVEGKKWVEAMTRYAR